MRVKSIVIDGFKSYAHRKELADLSPHFNAITGLNGSGKSNIFDAICFVMGITNLKKVRAEDPRELIFRAGTTGVHAARVTIELWNDDPATAPPGYPCEDFPIITIGRQIKVGGKQQFFFNNTVSMQSKVKRFFESISLNVDNPHFMVLQGTVHKLIGMKSQTLLSLIEEAVGTKAFDHRRRTAETLIRNKEKKMEEIDSNIEGQIGPMLEAMRADQEEYHKFLQASTDLEEKKAFRVAFEYFNRFNLLAEREEAMELKKEHVASSKEKLKGLPAAEEDLTRWVMRLQESMGAPSEAAMALHEQDGELKRQLGRLQGQLEACTRTLKQLEGQLKGLHKDRERQVKGQAEFIARREQHDALLAAIKEERERVGRLKQGLQLLQSGVRAGASGLSLEEERNAIDLRAIQMAAQVRRAKEATAGLTRQLEDAQAARAKQSGQLLKIEAELVATTATYQEEEARYAAIAPKEQRLRALEEEMAKAKAEYQRAYDAMQRGGGGGGEGARSFDLDYDRRACPAGTEEKIYGRVGQLVYPSEARFATALMVGAQAQLLRVVVESDAVAESVIRGGLRQRTSFLAMNQLQRPRPMEPRRVAAAEKLAKSMGGFVHVASDLVACKAGIDHLPGLAAHVYGSFLVCSSLALAQELAYSPDVKVKAVSVDGEVAEPNGLITGGSTNQLRDVFGELRAYEGRRAPLLSLQQSIAAMDREYAALSFEVRRQLPVIAAFKAAEDTLELARQRQQLAQGNSKSAIANVEGQLIKEREAIAATELELAGLAARKTEIDAEVAVDPDAARKDLQRQLAAAETAVARLTAQEEEEAVAFERLEADTEQRAVDLAAKTREAEEALAAEQRDRVQLQSQTTACEEKIADVADRTRRAEEQRQRIEREIEEAQEELARLAEQRATLDGVVKNGEVDLREMSKGAEELRRYLRDEEARHAWVTREKQNFGDRGGRFHFDDATRTQATLRELREVEAQAAVVSRRMNKKATILYEDRRKEYDDLVRQRAALGEDKAAIEQCIRGIEDKKWHALDRMVGVVSKIFGKLFAACLPGASAELMEERDDHAHLSGLGVRVTFNGKAKESLSELSGGQRSLLALCLILAILRVRPAPIYILDEVDAALDPSHTQNIGRMLQLYFPKSQFLLVSLKDGMFNNANVLYHVRNTQGYSEVTRVENKVAAAGVEAEAAAAEMAA